MVKVLSKRISIWLAKLWRQHPGVVFSLVVALIPFCVTVLYNIHIVDHRTISPEAVLAYLGGSAWHRFLFLSVSRAKGEKLSGVPQQKTSIFEFRNF